MHICSSYSCKLCEKSRIYYLHYLWRHPNEYIFVDTAYTHGCLCIDPWIVTHQNINIIEYIHNVAFKNLHTRRDEMSKWYEKSRVKINESKSAHNFHMTENTHPQFLPMAPKFQLIPKLKTLA